jgi:hypothetical protein
MENCIYFSLDFSLDSIPIQQETPVHPKGQKLVLHKVVFCIWQPWKKYNLYLFANCSFPRPRAAEMLIRILRKDYACIERATQKIKSKKFARNILASWSLKYPSVQSSLLLATTLLAKCPVFYKVANIKIILTYNYFKRAAKLSTQERDHIIRCSKRGRTPTLFK